MRGDPGSLYDAHAARLYAHGWSLLGDDAAAAVNDAFVAAVRHPPRGDVVLWMYALSRTAARSRGAFERPWQATSTPLPPNATLPAHAAVATAHESVLLSRKGDPLLRAAAALRAEQREALLLEAGEWLEIPDIAHVLGLAPDTVRQMLQTARTRLERGVLDALMRGEVGDGAAAAEVITAFEKGTLPRLLARRAPEGLPDALRAEVLESYEREMDEPSPTATSPSPLVVIGPAALGAPAEGTDAHRTAASARRRSRRTFGVVAGIAASAAAVTGLFASWSSVRGNGDETIVPSARTDRTASVTDVTSPATAGKAPDPNGTERAIGGTPSGAPNSDTTSRTASVPPQAGGSPSAPATPPAVDGGRRGAPSSPSGPGTGGTPSHTTPPSTPPGGTTPPTDPGTTGPTTPPPTVPPGSQPVPSPAPSPGAPTPAPNGN